MNKTHQSERSSVTWRDGNVPVSTRFDDPYYSLEDGLAETRHVFLEGNDLPARLRPGFHVAELGVGTGLNLLALARCAADIGTADIFYTGFEAYPLQREDLARALAPFLSLEDLADALLAIWTPDGFHGRVGPVTVRMILGDARDTLPGWDQQADAWFLDGFAPARNPQLWQDDLMAEVGRHTAPGGSFATYTAAGFVRRALQASGFEVERRTGFGRKRHMSVGHKP